MFVDADHAGDKRTRRSRTGFFIFLNSAVITWMSKRQPTIETSVFGAEFVAMKQGVETLRGIRYKLRMMGVPISGPSFVYGDNMSVIHNTQRPESTLRKKSNQICYHAVRESVAMNECLTGHIDKTKTQQIWVPRLFQEAAREITLLENFYMIYATMNEWLTPLCFSKMGLCGFPSRGKGKYSQPTPHQRPKHVGPMMPSSGGLKRIRRCRAIARRFCRVSDKTHADVDVNTHRIIILVWCVYDSIF